MALLGQISLMTGCSSCEAPSDNIDGKDLKGVFDRTNTTDAGIVAAPTASASASATASARATNVRAPASACVDVTGEMQTELRRTTRRPACRHAEILEWRDPLGAPRYACIFARSDVEERHPLPLLIFFHDGFADPTMVRKNTSLRNHARDFDMTGDPDRAGFIVLAPQGRLLGKGADGVIFDDGYTGSDNPDLMAIDHFVGVLKDKKIVDPERVYTVGAGHGGRMAAMYAAARADTVAAFATFASKPPVVTWTCPVPPPPAFIAYRDCDSEVACTSVESWITDREAARATTMALRLGGGDKEAMHCAVGTRCGDKTGLANHRRWPKGKEPMLLEFLAGQRLKLSR